MHKESRCALGTQQATIAQYQKYIAFKNLGYNMHTKIQNFNTKFNNKQNYNNLIYFTRNNLKLPKVIQISFESSDRVYRNCQCRLVYLFIYQRQDVNSYIVYIKLQYNKVTV